jgi:hypothetical protein
MSCLRDTGLSAGRNLPRHIVTAFCIFAGAFIAFIGLPNVADLDYGHVRETKPPNDVRNGPLSDAGPSTSFLRDKRSIQGHLIFHELPVRTGHRFANAVDKESFDTAAFIEEPAIKEDSEIYGHKLQDYERKFHPVGPEEPPSRPLEGSSTSEKSRKKLRPSKSSSSNFLTTTKPNDFRVSEQGEKKSNEKSTTQAIAPITTEDLQSISSRFYIYDDPTISQSHIVDERRPSGKEAFGEPAEIDHVKADMKGEKLILDALENHPLRTRNPNDAQIFVVPTPMTELLAYGCQWENCTWYDDAFRALSNHPIYKRTQGHRHVIVALSWPSFNKRYSSYFPALSRNYRLIENVTIAHNYDPFGCVKLHEQNKKKWGDFKKVYPGEMPVTNAFSLGLGFNDPFPITCLRTRSLRAPTILSSTTPE